MAKFTTYRSPQLLKRMELPQELRTLVNKSVAVLGQVILHELGEEKYSFIENLRLGMTKVCETSASRQFALLQSHYDDLKKLNATSRQEVARSFTLMLELMNACENAYRSYRLDSRAAFSSAKGEDPQSVIYVLTAHPTEARSPQNIEVFHRIQILLTQTLERHVRSASVAGHATLDFLPQNSADLLNLLALAWRTPITRNRSPRVKDEADHIYSLLFRDHVLLQLIANDECSVPFYVRCWVGGDKDGHPGVNENTLIESLTLSRQALLKLILVEFSQLRRSLELFPSKNLQGSLVKLERQLRHLRILKTNDAKLVIGFRTSFANFKTAYRQTIGATHPALRRLTQLNRTFPGLVVPLELRESSDILTKPLRERPGLAIFKMLTAVEKISRGGDPRWYTRGFIISMCESLEHIQAAAWMQKKVLRKLSLPIIPLFEEAYSLANSENIVTQFLQNTELRTAIDQGWGGQLELMVGYSDTSKEAGALASRLAISKALPRLEKICEDAGVVPIFFHGSGGSTDRGGGTVEDQTAWWPRSALRNYKVTVQGEMVERSLASPAIAKGQFESIVANVKKGLARPKARNPSSKALDSFAADIAKHYEAAIVSPEFLKVVEGATPYTYLSALKIGSRPSKRSAILTVKGLRAIPWALCWTQTRVLFQTWWGVGSAWKNLTQADRISLRAAFQEVPVFTSYIKALGFTLAKVELNVWRLYLTQAGQESAFDQFAKEFTATRDAYLDICGQHELMWFKPWLGESISLRAPMIHPLNMLQILSQKDKDLSLLRVTVTGISSGMMTTG